MRNKFLQSGFTPPPTLLQSLVSKIKKNMCRYFEQNSTGLVRREQSSQQKSWCRGFSLVETLVAITILLLVIIGPLTISSSSVRSSAFASEQVTAFFLAQEGAELAQMARDQYALENLKNSGSRPNPWADFSNQNGTFQYCYNATGCSTSMNTDNSGTLSSIRNCSDLANCKLYLNTSQSVVRSRYNHDNSGAATSFTRVIKFTRVGANEVSVVSTVTWQSGFSREVQQVSVQTSLLNIYGTN